MEKQTASPELHAKVLASIEESDLTARRVAPLGTKRGLLLPFIFTYYAFYQ